MKLIEAVTLAEKIKAVLVPFCARIEIAGSIRRARELVNDVDIVVLPKPGESEALLRTRCCSTATVITNAPMTLVFRLVKPPHTGVQVDLWIARQPKVELFGSVPTNFGALLLTRTGSREHNIYMIEHAKKMDLLLNPYLGVFAPDGKGGSKLLASETEEEIFAALNLPFIAPFERERPATGGNSQSAIDDSRGPVWANAFATVDEP